MSFQPRGHELVLLIIQMIAISTNFIFNVVLNWEVVRCTCLHCPQIHSLKQLVDKDDNPIIFKDQL